MKSFKLTSSAVAFVTGMSALFCAQPAISAPSLTSMSLEELMNVEVMSVSKHAEKLSEAASAIQVVTGGDISRSGAMTLPEALRLAPNLQTARVNAHDWAITARGFNGAPLGDDGLANKLLVMIDGRTVYTPLFGGVFWDAQNVMLEDVDRIEVVSGPGGTLWGSNAVNGVINVVSKSSKETQGGYASGSYGSFLRDSGVMRYGGKVNDDLHYRVYGQRFDYDVTRLSSGASRRDNWYMSQGGFRMDYEPIGGTDTLTFQGDAYDGSEREPTDTWINGENVLGRWTRRFSEESEMVVQTYFDHTWRELPLAAFTDNVKTYDIEAHHRFPIGEIHSITYGGGYRRSRDSVDNPTAATLRFFPRHQTMRMPSGFVQDEISLVPDTLKLTLGSKFEHNEFSKFDMQPSGRLAWQATDAQLLWGAISRAVHSPTRFDVDITAPLRGDTNFDSEKLMAYEAGYRVRVLEPLSVSIAGYYNQYDQIRSINNPPLKFGNGQEAISRGVELSGNYQAAEWWRLRGGYTYQDKSFEKIDPLVLNGSDLFEGLDPQKYWTMQSIMDLPCNFQLDVVGRYVSALPASSLTFTPVVSSYYNFDVRLGWKYEDWTFSIVGTNLWNDQNPEFASPGTALRIPRGVYANIEVDF